MEQLIYSSVAVALIILWMILNKRNMNKHILEVFEDITPKEEIRSNVSVRNFYAYCDKRKIDYDLIDEELTIKYNHKKIICTPDGDFRMGRTVLHMKKK